jgi:hypothetical protein
MPSAASSPLSVQRNAIPPGTQTGSLGSDLSIGRVQTLNMWTFQNFSRLLLVLLLMLMLGCTGRRITKSNVDQVAEGMSKKQVESILGPPTDIDNKDFVIMKKTTYIYRQGKDAVTIVFKDDKVTDKQNTISD